MAREGLTISRWLLKQRPIPAQVFDDALNAILVHADRLKPWRGVLEKAFASLTSASQRQVSRTMFRFYIALPDWSAANHLVPEKSLDPVDLLFSMWTYLELRDDKRATRVFRKCRRVWESLVRDEFNRETKAVFVSTLIEAMALYQARMGRWGEAVELWTLGKENMPFAPNAWEGLIKLHTLRACLETNDALERIRDDEFWTDDCAIVLPKNQTALREKHDRQFQRFARHLANIVPHKERWRFGL